MDNSSNIHNPDGLTVSAFFGKRAIAMLSAYLLSKTTGGAAVSVETTVADLALAPVVEEREEWSAAILKTLPEPARDAVKALPEYQAFRDLRTDYLVACDMVRFAVTLDDDLKARFAQRRGPNGGICRRQTEEASTPAPRKMPTFDKSELELYRQAIDSLLATGEYATASRIVVKVREIQGLPTDPTDMGRYLRRANEIMRGPLVCEYKGHQGKGYLKITVTDSPADSSADSLASSDAASAADTSDSASTADSAELTQEAVVEEQKPEFSASVNTEAVQPAESDVAIPAPQETASDAQEPAPKGSSRRRRAERALATA